jgi:hypothetical protein
MIPRLVSMRPLVLGVFATFVVVSCGGGIEAEHPVPCSPPQCMKTAADEPKKAIIAEVSDLDIHFDGIDRFASCPPAGEIGQAWIPPLPEWTPSASKSDDAGLPAPINVTSPDESGRTPTERAIEDTRSSFRACYHRGLVLDPTQHGHVAIVARVGPDGRVQKVESYAACEIVKETITCMQDAARALRFAPPKGGSDTIVLPAVFSARDGMSGRVTAVDNYTESAYLAVEEMRPELHQCLDDARREGRGYEAWAHFDVTLDSIGHVDGINVDPFGGDQDLLQCAASVVNKLHFPAPGVEHGHVIVRVRFNPRLGSR